MNDSKKAFFNLSDLLRNPSIFKTYSQYFADFNIQHGPLSISCNQQSNESQTQVVMIESNSNHAACSSAENSSKMQEIEFQNNLSQIKEEINQEKYSQQSLTSETPNLNLVKSEIIVNDKILEDNKVYEIQIAKSLQFLNQKEQRNNQIIQQGAKAIQMPKQLNLEISELSADILSPVSNLPQEILQDQNQIT